MDDHLLVEALRARDSGAPAALYDAYAERLYAYSWMRLREQDTARAAVRDAFVVAEAQIERLGDPRLLVPWLYALAKLECDRREPDQEPAPDLPVASHDQDDVDERLLAWRAAAALSPRLRELADLHVRHDLSLEDVARVTRTPVKQIEEELGFAGVELETALVAEILVDQGPFGCADRAALLRARRGELTPLLREQLAAHAGGCDECAAFKPRTVSLSKVFRLLLWAPLPDDLRERVLGSFLDPELVGYRLFIATRVMDYGPEGFPIWPHRSALARRMARRGHTSQARTPAQAEAPVVRRSGKLVATAVAVLVSLTGIPLTAFLVLTGQQGRGTHAIANGTGPRPTMLPSSGLSTTGAGSGSASHATPVSATYPIGTSGSADPSTALPSRPHGAGWFPSGGVQDPGGIGGLPPTSPGQRREPGTTPPEDGPGSSTPPPSSPPPTTPPATTTPLPTSPPSPSSPPSSTPESPPPSSSTEAESSVSLTGH